MAADRKARLTDIRCPRALRALRGWLVWRLEHIAGEKKPRKVPYYANGSRRAGVQGSTSDRAQLTTFDAAIQVASQGYDGVGLALLEGFGVTGLDFDNCVGSDGLDPAVEAMVAGTYAEFSPSGTGIHAFVVGDLGNRKSPAGAEFGFETFSTKGYLTFTGQPLDVTEMADSLDVVGAPSPAVINLYRSRFPRAEPEAVQSDEAPLGLSEAEIEECLRVLDSDCGHDEWLRVGMALHHETMGAGFALWDNWSSTGTKYPGREALEFRWESLGQSGIHPVTARSLLRAAREHGATISFGTADADDFEILAPETPPPGGHFNIRSAADFIAHQQPPRWLIKGVLPHAQIGILFGEPASGKSFLALDISASLSSGCPWNGRENTGRHRVLYVVAEGSGGFAGRIRALPPETPPENLDIIWDIVPNLMDPKQCMHLIADIQAREPYDLIVMDTFAQMTPGANENSGEDMGCALAHCRRINAATGAMVLLVHHSGKDTSKGARGWSGLAGAADAIIEVTRFEQDRVATVVKMKDGQDGAEFGFKLVPVVLGQDEDGDDITSCVIEYTDAKRAKSASRNKIGKLERLVLSVVSDLVGLGNARILQDTLITSVVAQIPQDPGKRDQRRGAVVRAVTTLGTRNFLRITEGFVELADAVESDADAE